MCAKFVRVRMSCLISLPKVDKVFVEKSEKGCGRFVRLTFRPARRSAKAVASAVQTARRLGTMPSARDCNQDQQCRKHWTNAHDLQLPIRCQLSCVLRKCANDVHVQSLALRQNFALECCNPAAQCSSPSTWPGLFFGVGGLNDSASAPSPQEAKNNKKKLNKSFSRH